MKTSLRSILALAGFVNLLSLGNMSSSDLPPLRRSAASKMTYEVAVIDKSMTGDWPDERAFRHQVRQQFQTTNVLRFKLKSQELYAWLEQHTTCATKVICLVDGWTSPELRQVDVRAWRGKETFEKTFKVEGNAWRAALTSAKLFADSLD